MTQSSLEFFFDLAIEQKLYSNKRNLKTHLNFIFDNFDFKEKNMLDVGGGSGLLSFYAGLKARRKTRKATPRKQRAGPTLTSLAKFLML